MKKKNRSDVSLSVAKTETQHKEDIYVPPLDVLDIKLRELRIADEDPKPYVITVAFFDQLLISSVITSTGGRDVKEGWKKTIARGHMNYDPSDYEKMSLFADNPLIIKIHPVRSVESDLQGTITSTRHSDSTKSLRACRPNIETHCCNIDILSLFIGREFYYVVVTLKKNKNFACIQPKLIDNPSTRSSEGNHYTLLYWHINDSNEMNLKKRLEPMIKPSVLLAKSWANLPLITISLKRILNPANTNHQDMFRNANYMKMSLIGSYNMIIPFDEEYVYTSASKLPLQGDEQTTLFTYNNGYRLPRNFNNMSFYPQWESLRYANELFTRGDEKFQNNIENLHNEENIDLNYYLNKLSKQHSTLWASFHRTLFLKDTELWLTQHIRQYKWPIEVHIYGENKGFSFMGFIDLFQLLHPGVKTARLVVPLQWVDAEIMMTKCGCELLLAPNDKLPSVMATVQKCSKATTESAPASTNTEVTYVPRATGSDDNCAFVIVEVTLARPFKEPVIPPHISDSEIKEMLIEMEVIPTKRVCTGRGQLDSDWQATVRGAANSLQRLPYFGITDICTINRQLSETRTRIELVTSFWQDAAIYVNNNFILSDFLCSDDTFEEMLMIAHACLVRIANETLLTVDNRLALSPTLRAARHARHLQDLHHALDLYLQLVAERPRDANSWRELATCLKDVDNDWANVCINKAIMLNPRNALSLLSKGGAIFEVDPDAAEPFFTALLALYPFYISLWVAASAYYLHRELFHMAHEIMVQVKNTEAQGLSEEMCLPRAWEGEMGDWWDNTPLLPGTSHYYDAADLLIRVRAVSLAEVCVARALSECGESPIYYHMVALCCRIRGHYEDALCHLKQGVQKFGAISYLKSLEGECYHRLKDYTASIASFEKAGSCSGPYFTMLSLPRRDHIRTRSILTDLTRRHPSAYAWMAFADNWMMQSAMGEGGDAYETGVQRAAPANATACALNALKCDRRAGRSWALLATLLKPNARREYCKEMAILCGENKLLEKCQKHVMASQPSLCFRIGQALRECRCKVCEHLKF